MSFGVTSDPFAIGDTHWRPQNLTEAPTAAGEAQAMDSNGDVQASTVYGRAKAWTQPFKVVGGDSGTTFNVNTHIKLGTIKVPVGDSGRKAICTSVEVATSNTDFPVVTCGFTEFFGDTANQAAYTIPGVATLTALKRAQSMGVVVSGVNRLNSCNLSASLQVVQVADSLGAFVQTAGYQGRAEATAEAINAAGAPTIAADTANSWATSKDQDVATSNTEYGKATLSVFKNILPDS